MEVTAQRTILTGTILLCIRRGPNVWTGSNSATVTAGSALLVVGRDYRSTSPCSRAYIKCLFQGRICDMHPTWVEDSDFYFQTVKL